LQPELLCLSYTLKLFGYPTKRLSPKLIVTAPKG